MLCDNVIDQWKGQIQDWLSPFVPYSPFSHIQSLTLDTAESISQIHLDRLTDIVEENMDQIRDVLFFRINPTLPDFFSSHMNRWSFVSDTFGPDIKSITKVSSDYIDELQQITNKNIDDMQRMSNCFNPLAMSL